VPARPANSAESSARTHAHAVNASYPEHLREEVEDGVQRRGARARFRQQRGGGKVERLRDAAQHARGRVAGAAFDLRQIALRRLRSLRQLPARHAALGAIAPHLASDRGEKRCGPAAARRGGGFFTRFYFCSRLGHDNWLYAL